MSEITENEINNMTKEQNYMRGYKDGREDTKEKAYQQGRADKYQEITSEYMLLTEKQVAEIRTNAIEEFAALLKDMANSSSTKYIRISDYAFNRDSRFYNIDEIAKELKEKI